MDNFLETINRLPTANHRDVHFFVQGTETDYRDRLQLAALFSFMQEAAFQDAEHYGAGASALDPLGVCWLLSRVSVRLSDQPVWCDKLTVETWSRGAPRLFFLRDFVLRTTGQDDEHAFGAATSEWFLVNKDTRAPIRPSELSHINNLPNEAVTGRVFSEACVRIPAPAVRQAVPILQRRVEYSDVDRNGHLNNTRYIGWMMDAIMRERQLAPLSVRELDINYVSEVFWDESLEIRIFNAGTEYWAEGFIVERETAAFRARVAGE